MSIKERIDEKLKDYARDHPQDPMRIVLSPKAIGNFVHELQNYALGEFGTARSIYTCPNCGESLLTYAGYPIEAMTDEDVMIE